MCMISVISIVTEILSFISKNFISDIWRPELWTLHSRFQIANYKSGKSIVKDWQHDMGYCYILLYSAQQPPSLNPSSSVKWIIKDYMIQQYICSTTNSHECLTFDVFDTKAERKILASDVGAYWASPSRTKSMWQKKNDKRKVGLQAHFMHSSFTTQLKPNAKLHGVE